MSGTARLGLLGLVAGAAGWAGLAAGERGISVAMLADQARMQIASWQGTEAAVLPAVDMQKAVPSGPVIYYRHPDGLAEWSGVPKATVEGRGFLPVHASEDVSFDPEAMVAAPETEQTVLYYRNPMGLPDTSPVPKQDSMGMDYLPVFAGEAGDAGTVRVSPGKLQRTGVRTATAVTGAMEMVVRAPGVVALDERRISVIALRADAFITSVAEVTTGATIQAGDPLAMLYSPEVATATAQFIADLRSNGTPSPGARQRLQNLGLPDAVIDAIAAERRPPVSIALTAPRDGVVLERMAVEGMMAEAGQTLFRIADTSVVWVMAEVPETALTGLRRGAAAKVSFRGLPGEVFAGVIDAIYPAVDMQTRTARLRIDIANPDGRLLANMYAEVELNVGNGAMVVQVPDSAVIDTGDRQVVIRDLGEGRFAPQDVVPGQRGAGMVEIRSGIAAGDRIVTTATFLIDAESNLNAALAALATPEAGQ